MSCGQPIPDQWVVIADPDGTEVPDGTVGEIWLYGNNIARGYFRREEETRRVFANRLQSRLHNGSHAEGAPDDSYWLATGDLGVYVDGELYLTGRIKDLIIIDEMCIRDSLDTLRDRFGINIDDAGERRAVEARIDAILEP